MRMAMLLFILSIVGVRATAHEALIVTATPVVVTWTGAPGGCVYWRDDHGARVRLGCSDTSRWDVPPGVLAPGDSVEVRYPTRPTPRTGRAAVHEEPMEPSPIATGIADLVRTIASASEADRRQLLTNLYTELQAAGLPEPVAAALQHQVAQAARMVDLPTHGTTTREES